MHVGQLEGDALLLGDGLVERAAVLGVGHRVLDGSPGHARHHRCQRHAGVVDDALHIAALGATEPRGSRHLDPLELKRRRAQALESEILLGPRDAEARCVARDDEGVAATVAARNHEEMAGSITERHEALGAGQYESVVTFGLRQRARRRRIEERARLAQCDGRRVDGLAAEQRQQLALLLVAALVGDREGEGRRREGRNREGGVAPGKLL